METKKFDLFDVVTKKIINQLEQGNIPWKKSWSCGYGAINYVTRRSYEGINLLLLPYEGEYLSFKQVTDAGGYVKQNEKANMVVFWKWLEHENIKDNGEIEIKRTPLLKYYNVFHLSQCAGIESKLPEKQINNPITEAENIVNSYCVRENILIKTVQGSDDCFYSPANDYISLPIISQFDTSEEYYSTLFHECVHSTGHKSRLNRFESLNNAAAHKESYSKEELIAEMGAAFLNNIAGIDNDKLTINNASYIKGWLSTIKNNNNRFVIDAAGKAKTAVKLIVNDTELQNN